MVKQFVFKTVALILGLALAITLTEILLRIDGYQPWVYIRQDAKEPIMSEPDAVLGWKNKQGTYTVPPYHPAGQAIKITLLEKGRRSTGENSKANSEREFVIVGDSFTHGAAISDSETYAWKLQKKFPFFQVLNYGTPGYGSYQSLLLLERELPHLARPKFVLYGFIEHHEVRNVALGSWLEGLSLFSRRSYVAVPFATFDPQKGLIRHPPEHYLSLPFRESFAVIPLVARAYMNLKTNQRSLQKRLVTEQILLQMNRVSKNRDAIFVVVLFGLNDEAREHYVKFLRVNQIHAIDCVYNLTDELKVPGEGHPNGKMNALWTECIAASLNNQFGEIGTHRRNGFNAASTTTSKNGGGH